MLKNKLGITSSTEYKNGMKELNLIIETKNKEKKDLSNEERNKIKSAEKLFSSDFFNVKFKTQMSNRKMVEIINDIIK